jgi:hypothetical protein
MWEMNDAVNRIDVMGEMKVMRLLVVSLILIGVAEPAFPQESWTPTPKVIKEFEATVKLPDLGQSTQYPHGHIPAPSEFARYYIGSISNGHHVLSAEFVLADGRSKPGIFVVDTLRRFRIADGGCGVVHIEYDVEDRRVESLKCNGFG